MGELIDFLLFAIFIVYIVRSIARLVMPVLFQNVVNKAQQNQSAGRQQQNYNSNASAGKVKVDFMPETKRGAIPDSEGEFIDYEEVK